MKDDLVLETKVTTSAGAGAGVEHTGSLNVWACAKNALEEDTVQNGARLVLVLLLHLTLNKLMLQEKKIKKKQKKKTKKVDQTTGA